MNQDAVAFLLSGLVEEEEAPRLPQQRALLWQLRGLLVGPRMRQQVSKVGRDDQLQGHRSLEELAQHLKTLTKR